MNVLETEVVPSLELVQIPVEQKEDYPGWFYVPAILCSRISQDIAKHDWNLLWFAKWPDNSDRALIPNGAEQLLPSLPSRLPWPLVYIKTTPEGQIWSKLPMIAHDDDRVKMLNEMSQIISGKLHLALQYSSLVKREIELTNLIKSTDAVDLRSFLGGQ